MIQVNAMGDACPIPVVKTLQAVRALGGAEGVVETLVWLSSKLRGPFQNLDGRRSYRLVWVHHQSGQ